MDAVFFILSLIVLVIFWKFLLPALVTFISSEVTFPFTCLFWSLSFKVDIIFFWESSSNCLSDKLFLSLTFHLCSAFVKWYFAALCFALSVPWFSALHCMLLSLLSNIAGEDPKAEKFSKRLGAWLGFISLAPWISDLHILYSQCWNALGRFALAPRHSTDSLCGSGSRCTRPAFKLHLFLFSSHEARQWQEAFLPLTPQLPSFLPGLFAVALVVVFLPMC